MYTKSVPDRFWFAGVISEIIIIIIIIISVIIVVVVAVQKMSRYRCCHHDNVVVIVVILSLTTLAVCTEDATSRQGQGYLKVSEVTGEGHVPLGDAAAAERWMKNKLVRIRSAGEDSDHLPSSAAGSATTRRGQRSSESGRSKRSSAYPSRRINWFSRKHVPAAAPLYDDDASWWLAAAPRRLPVSG